MKRYFRTPMLASVLLLVAQQLPATAAAEPDDIIARVGDEIITFRDLDRTINSSAMVGIPIPTPGTPERTAMRLTLLDRLISADLLYLDALGKGLDENAVFRHEQERYSDAILASMYKEKVLVGELPVSDEEIRAYFRDNFKEGTAFTQDLHMAIEAKLRKTRFKEKIAALRDTLRKGVEVEVYADRLDPGGDQGRDNAEVMARVDGTDIAWGELRSVLVVPGNTAGTPADRRERLEQYIDKRLMVSKARAAGMEQDDAYQHRMNEYRKSLLVDINKGMLAEEFDPTDDEVRSWFADNNDKVVVPELRKIQMVVTNTQAEAADIKRRIEAGEITFFQAARDHSIDPSARMTLGELGWVPQGSGFPDLDDVTFSLQPDQIGGPVESPAGWHLVKVLERRAGHFEDIDDRETWKKAHRLLLKEKENSYVSELRRTAIKVEVDDKLFSELTQQEVDRANAGKAAAKDASDGT